MSAEGARLLIARQRARNRVFVVVAASAAALDTAIVVLLAAAISRAVAGAIAALALVSVMAVISAADAARSPERVRRRSGRLPLPDEVAKLEPVVTRLAERLGINTPMLRIVDDHTLNAFAAYSGPKATIFYASGFLEEFGRPGDEPLLEAVTAHLLARIATGDTRLTVVMDGLLNWAHFLVRWVFAGFVWVLGMLGWGYVTSDAPKRLKPATHVYGDDMVNRLIVWGISVFIGLCLIMAAVVVALLGGVTAFQGYLS